MNRTGCAALVLMLGGVYLTAGLQAQQPPRAAAGSPESRWNLEPEGTDSRAATQRLAGHARARASDWFFAGLRRGAAAQL